MKRRSVLDDALSRALTHCLDTQTAAGAWETFPEARIFETALLAHALRQSNEHNGQEASVHAMQWLNRAVPQRHHPIAACMEETLLALTFNPEAMIDLTASQLYEPLALRKTLLLYALAVSAGHTVKIHCTAHDIKTKITQAYRDLGRGQCKQWGKVDILSAYLLLCHADLTATEIAAICRELGALQSPDGSFAYNPISTAVAFIALTHHALDSTAWRKSYKYLLKTQQSDGTWRFATSDIWDTTLMVRAFSKHPLFRAHALDAAVEFIKFSQNLDGGWGFRSDLESDNDTTSCALLALDRAPSAEPAIRQGLTYLAGQQLDNGLWRTWLSKEDLPVEDVVAHVVTALDFYSDTHLLSTAQAKQWLVDRYQAASLWQASWYRSLPYAVFEITQALPLRHPIRQHAITTLKSYQNADGGWGQFPGEVSIPSATGLAVSALFANGYASDAATTQALTYLIDTQNADGTWPGLPEMFGPRPLVSHFQTHTQAFVCFGLVEAWHYLHPHTYQEGYPNESHAFALFR